MSAAVSKEVTVVEIAGVTFGFFTDEEVRTAMACASKQSRHGPCCVHTHCGCSL